MDPITRQASIFSPWRPVGPPTLIFPAGAILTALARRPGRIDLIAAGNDGNFWLAPFEDTDQGTGWSRWTSVGQMSTPDAPPPGPPDSLSSAMTAGVSPSLNILAVVKSPESVELMLLASDGGVWTGRCDPDHEDVPTNWHPIWLEHRAAPGTVLTAVSLGPDHLRVIAVGADGAAWTNVWDSSFDWGAWEPIGDAGIIDPCRRQRIAAITRGPSHVEAFAIDRAGRVITTSLEEGQRWEPWGPVGAETIFSPQAQVTALSSDPDHVVLFAPAKDGSVWTTTREGAVFRPWTRIGEAGMLAVPPRMAVSALLRGTEEIELFVPGRDGSVYESSGTATGGFRDWTRLQGLSFPVPAQAILTAVSCRPNRVDLFVVRSDGVIHGACRFDAGTRAVVAPPPAPIDPPPEPASPAEPPSPALARLKRLKAAVVKGPQRHAILIGINRYVDPNLTSLKFCVNDVIALKETLEKAGYASVLALHDDAPDEKQRPTRENIKVELMTLCESLAPDDLVLVHFSCHGTLIGNKPHLLPSNTRTKILEETAMAVDEVMRILASSAARRVVVLLDACHAGADLGRDVSGPALSTDFVHNVYEMAEGTRVLAGSTSQQKARERDDAERGVFTSFVIEALARTEGFAAADRERKGFVTFDDLRDHVCDGVMQWSRVHGIDLQRPNDSGQSTGDMIVADYR